MIFTETGNFQTNRWRVIFDALPLPAFIVDEDVRILDFNPAAEKLLGFAPKSALRRRGGEVFHCVQVGKAGCGKSKSCKNCAIRNSVADAIKGLNTRRKFCQPELRDSRGVVLVSLFVTASLLPETSPPQALLVLEDVAETVRIYNAHRSA
ncbi:MAG: PAS domain-containing protein [Verrucomicrobiota bacterium]